MVSKELIKKNKKRLLEEKKRLEELLSRVAKRDPKGGDFHPTYEEFGSKEDENALEVAAFAERIAEQHDLGGKLRQVLAALKRIAEGGYGICKLGGEEMPAERLEAVPEAENCIKHEK